MSITLKRPRKKTAASAGKQTLQLSPQAAAAVIRPDELKELMANIELFYGLPPHLRGGAAAVVDSTVSPF